MGKGFFRLKALLDIHVEGSVKQISEVVQLGDSGSTLGDASSGIVDPSLDITADLLLLFDLAYRKLNQVSQ